MIGFMSHFPPREVPIRKQHLPPKEITVNDDDFPAPKQGMGYPKAIAIVGGGILAFIGLLAICAIWTEAVLMFFAIAILVIIWIMVIKHLAEGTF